jgi:hypothetical protein
MTRRVGPGAKRRLHVALYLLCVTACTAAALGILNATTVAATIPTEVRMDLSVSVKVNCRIDDLVGTVHSGSPEYHPSLTDKRSPLAQARDFASITGVTERFPGLVTAVHSTPSPRTTLVAFRELGGIPRGALQYYGSAGDGWQLVHAWYC